MKTYSVAELINKLDKLQINDFDFNSDRFYTCISYSDDDIEICFQATDRKIPLDITNLAVAVFKDFENYKQAAMDRLKSWVSDEDYFVVGVYFGTFLCDAHANERYFNGFTITLKKWSDSYDDIYTLYTIKFKSDGWPIGMEMWFE